MTLLSQYTAREATSSQPTIKEEEEEVVNVSDSEDDFEVFNLPSPSENSVGDLSLLPLAQVSCSQEDPTILEAMPIQRRTRQSLWDLMESQVKGQEQEKAIQPKLSTLLPTQAQHPDLANHKRKRDQPKGREVVEGGKSHSSKELSPKREPNMPG